MTRLRVATRASPLARWQAEHVASLLRAADPTLAVELVPVQTTGDANTEVPLHAIGGRGVFVKEVQQAVLDGRADVAVHSAKDLPSQAVEGLVIAAVPPRGDARDALVGAPLAGLGVGATVATGSVRRRTQLAVLRPDLHFAELRGNIGTRLARVPPGGAVVVAQAALDRLGLAGQAAEVMAVDRMVPQVGQGALAVECRAGDERVRRVLAAVDHAPSHRAVAAERAFLAAFGGGCDVPVGAHLEMAGDEAVLHAYAAPGDALGVAPYHAVHRAPATADLEALAGAAGRAALRQVRGRAG